MDYNSLSAHIVLVLAFADVKGLVESMTSALVPGPLSVAVQFFWD